MLQIVKNRGFTYIEILITAMLLSIVLSYIILFQLNTINYNRYSLHQITALSQLEALAILISFHPSNFDGLYQRWNENNADWLPNGHGKIERKASVSMIRLYWHEQGTTRWPCGDRAIKDMACLELAVFSS